MKTTVTDRTTAYDEVGQGFPLVLIHGFPLNRSIWKPQLDVLAKYAHVIAPDLRGFGESEMVGDPILMSTYADDIRELLDTLGINEPATIAGHSMGGYVALEYLNRYPAHVEGLILINTKMTPDTIQGKEGRDRNIALAKQKGASAIAEAMLPKMFSPKTYTSRPDLVAQLKAIMEQASVPALVAALGAMKERQDYTGVVLEFGPPTLILTGADDQLIPPSESEAIRLGSRNGTLVMIPDGGHVASMEQPELFNQEVIQYLPLLREE